MNDRLQIIRNKMAGMNLQGMIISNPVNIRYLTKIEAEGLLLITRKENIFITDGRYIEYVSSIITPFDEIVVDDQKNVSQYDYENFFLFCENVGFEEKHLTYSEYKEYIAEFKLGYLTDTLDDTGNIIKRSNKIVQKDEIINIINSYKKEYFQTVPLYSAVKVNGKKLYEYARNNIDIELPKRKVIIKNIDILNIGETIKIKCLVSKGTYIRSLIDDIGKSLGTYATMTKLVRIRQGNYIIDNSYTIEDIKNNNFKIITIEEIFNEAERINIENELYQRVINGNILDNIYNNEYVLFFYKNKLISVYKEYEKSKIKPLIML